MADQADVDRWAALVARAYAEACNIPLSNIDEARLAYALTAALTDCIVLAISPSDWGSFYVDLALARWEAGTRRQLGPRLGRIDCGRGTVEMRR